MRRSIIARLVAILTIAVVLCAIVIGALLPLNNWRMKALAQADAAATERVALEASLDRLKAQKSAYVIDDFASLVWSGTQSAQVTAKVQSTVNSVGQAAGVNMRSITPTRSNADENTVGFRMEFEAQLDQLSDLVRNLEFNQPALIITGANIRRLARPGEPTLLPTLFVQLDVTAPIRIQESASR